MHTSPSTFIKSFISFDSSFLQVFGCLLGIGFFDSLKGILIHKQDFFLILFGGIGFISITTIGPITYLGNWALVILIRTIRFMVDEYPFLFKSLT
jgi:hypothetical protein